MLTQHEARTAVYERRTPRWVHLVVLVATIGLTAAMAWFGLLREVEPDAFGRTEEIDPVGKVIFGFFVLIGVFLSGVFGYRLVRNPPYFVMYPDGFEYAPGGVSTGLIKWTDVQELRDETVLQGGPSGPVRQPVTAVVLRNTAEYIERFPAALKPLFAARMAMNSSPILISKAEFGRDHTAILTVMRDLVAKHQAK